MLNGERQTQLYFGAFAEAKSSTTFDLIVRASFGFGFAGASLLCSYTNLALSLSLLHLTRQVISWIGAPPPPQPLRLVCVLDSSKEASSTQRANKQKQAQNCSNKLELYRRHLSALWKPQGEAILRACSLARRSNWYFEIGFDVRLVRRSIEPLCVLVRVC